MVVRLKGVVMTSCPMPATFHKIHNVPTSFNRG